MPHNNVIPKTKVPKGTHLPKTKAEKKKAAEISKKFPASKRYKQNIAKGKKAVPTIVFVNEDSTLHLNFSRSKWNPNYIKWMKEYITDCLASYIERERFLAGVSGVEVQERVEGTDEEGRPIVIKRTVNTLKKEREALDPKDRYMPIVKLPTLEGFMTHLFMKYDLVANFENLYGYRAKYPKFDDMCRLLLKIQGDLIQQHSTNGLGNSTIQKLQLMNNHGWQDIKQINKDMNVNISAKGLFDEMYALSHQMKTPEKQAIEVEAKDINHVPEDE
jgi:hypothetical protein